MVDKKVRVGDVHAPEHPVAIRNFEKAHWKDAGSNNLQDSNDINKTLPASVERTLQKMFRLSENSQILMDGQGKFSVQARDVHGANEGSPAIIDVNKQSVEIQRDLAYHAERHIISEHTGIGINSLNQVKKIDGNYHYIDENGAKQVTDLTNDQKDRIKEDKSSLGLNDNRKPIPASVEKDLLEKASEKVKDSNLKENIKKGMIHSDYDYGEKSGEYKFYMIPMRGDKDGPTELMSIKKDDLSSQVKNGLEYHERKVAVMNQLGLENEIQDLKVVNDELHFKGIDGTPDKRMPTDTQWKNIEAHLDAKGFFNNTQQISESVKDAALQHAIDKTDPAKRAALADATVYDYTYDKKSKEHVYHILTKETSPSGDGGTEVRDGKMEKIPFTDEEHKKLLEDATLNAVKKNGELPDGRKITDGMVVAFDPNDKNQFLVKDTDEGEHTLTGDSGISDGRKLKDAIASELNVKPRDNTEILSDKHGDVKISTKEADSVLDALRERLANMEAWSPHVLRFMRVMAYGNRAAIQAGQSIGQVEAQLLHSTDSPGPQQPMGDVATEELNKMARKRIRDSMKVMREKIKIAQKEGKGTLAGKGIEKMDEIRQMITTNKGPATEGNPDGEKLYLFENQQEELLRDMDNDSDTTSESSDGIRPFNDRYNPYYANNAYL